MFAEMLLALNIASAVIVVVWLVLLLLLFFLNCNYKFQHTRLCSFQNLILSLRVILKVLLIFLQISPLRFLFNQFLSEAYHLDLGDMLLILI